MKNKIIYITFITIIFVLSLSSNVFASDPKLISTLNGAFEKLEGYLLNQQLLLLLAQEFL